MSAITSKAHINDLHTDTSCRCRRTPRAVIKMPKDLEHLISEGRGKLLPISCELVLDCIVTKTTEITRIARVSLPDEMHVTSVFYDDRAGCFMFVIYSEAFDPVPLGREVPLFHDYEMVSLDVTKRGGSKQ